jgi:hypothetical protein
MIYLVSFFIIFLTSCSLFVNNQTSQDNNTLWWDIEKVLVTSESWIIMSDWNTTSWSKETINNPHNYDRFIQNENWFTFKSFDHDWDITIKKWKDWKYREDKLWYVVYNPESCVYNPIKGIYDWIDEDYSIDPAPITEAWCFKNYKEFEDVSYWTYIEDENWTYYWDKDGWAYNLNRISTKTGWTLIENHLYYNDYPEPLFWIDNKVFYYGVMLSWVTSPYSLKVLSLKSSSRPFISDWRNVWYYKSNLEWIDSSSLKFVSSPLSGDNISLPIYVDKKHCFLMWGDMQKLTDCNPKKIKRIKDFTTDERADVYTPTYFDWKNTYGPRGAIIKN